MGYSFVIDNRRCIGCHACTVACKAEHEVPLGSFRTWVKYVEKGTFPDVRRFFTVLRCNHCNDAPCVNICPTRALHHRPDGIVDFARSHCIGCRSCMAACPYDALYIDPATETAAKCNYCAHKIEVGLEPACVTVCPEQAIVAGDAADPGGRVAQLTTAYLPLVRKPELSTGPNVYYIQAEPAALRPLEVPRDAAYLWADRPEGEIREEHRQDEAPAGRTTYDIPHERPWGGLVSLYLWAKSMAAGPILVAALLTLLGAARAPALFCRLAPSVSLAFAFLTVLLLVADLERPGRFLKVLTHPNPRSWLVWGAYTLIAFSVVSMAWLGQGLHNPPRIGAPLLWSGMVLAALTAGYSGALLRQARGRELWSSRLLIPHLVVQAFLAGAAILSCAVVSSGPGGFAATILLRCVLAGLCAHGILVLLEIMLPGRSPDAARAVSYMTAGPIAARFWIGAVLLGIAVPVYLLALLFTAAFSDRDVALAAAILPVIGLLVYDDCYIRAGQSVPLS
jgi:Fe-S-cluster-containing dehydrogenase component/formate-dependent nitrite reductase membrane component NrfD